MLNDIEKKLEMKSFSIFTGYDKLIMELYKNKQKYILAENKNRKHDQTLPIAIKSHDTIPSHSLTK